MHIPDGFLSPPVWLTFDAISVPAVAWVARRKASAAPNETSGAPLFGVMGAFVFAAQMVNFPVGYGASAHLLGGALLTTILGPSAAVLVMTAVLILQAVLFQDGGVLALGANVFNMAIAGVGAAYLPLRLWGHSAGSVFLAGTLSVTVSAALMLWQLALSGVVIQGQPLWIATGLLVLTAVLEGAITVATARAAGHLHPRVTATASTPHLKFAAAAILLVTAGLWVASSSPDILENLASQTGLEERAAWIAAPLAGYQLTLAGSGWLAQALAGVAGLACIYAVCTLAAKRR